MHVLKSKKELYETVMNDYMNHDAELCGLFFNLHVEMKKGEILKAYAELMDRINGDDVTYPESQSLSEVYKGNCKDFLEGLNGEEGYHRYCYGNRDDEVDFVL